MNPDSLRPWRNAAARWAESSAEVMRKKPITGLAPSNADTPSGQLAAAPPSKPMNSRRFMPHPRVWTLFITENRPSGNWSLGDIGNSGLVSAPGQTLDFDLAPVTSGLPPLTDILRVSRHVSNVPRGDSCTAANDIAIR